MDDMEPNIRLENDNGVTTDDLISELGAYLYGGQSLPLVYHDSHCDLMEEHGRYLLPIASDGTDQIMKLEAETERRYQISLEYRFPALVYAANWLTQSVGEGAAPQVYDDGWDTGVPPTIWLFCCPPESFEARVGEERRKAEKREARRREVEEQKSRALG